VELVGAWARRKHTHSTRGVSWEGASERTDAAAPTVGAGTSTHTPTACRQITHFKTNNQERQ